MEKIQWAPRVPMNKIRVLYQSEASGRLDEELLQDVGYAFLARAESIIATNRIHEKQIVDCPVCGKKVRMADDFYRCALCGWALSAKGLFMTYKGKQFIGPSIVGFAEKFIGDWNAAMRDPVREMLAIDYLIHRFHWEMTERPTRPVAINYIDGKLEQIKALILELAYGDQDEMAANRASWEVQNEKSRRVWAPHEFVDER